VSTGKPEIGKRPTSQPSTALALVGLALLAAAPLILPDWVGYNLHLALAKSLVVLGVALLLRGGLVSFGHGLFFAAGAYSTGFATRWLEIRDMLVQLGLALLVSMALAMLLGLVMSRHRGIFFSMLSLGFSMILYALLLKYYGLTGGTDGMRIRTPSFLGNALDRETFRLVGYYVALGTVAAGSYIAYRFMASPMGYLVRAIRDNEVRVEYLGASVPLTLHAVYVLSGGLAGLSGGLTAHLVGHIVPELAYWTISGEFVFAALLGGFHSVLGPLAGSVVFEFARSYAFKYAAFTWQMMLGIIMLAIIAFLPGGVWSLYTEAARRIGRWTSSSKR
jgi:ABC-type branched-subunit amino acid transport system permease subunit